MFFDLRRATMAATSVVVRPHGMAPTGYRCPICQETTKSFRSLLHHVQWWHGFCRDAPSSPQPRSEGESVPNYNLVRKRDAYLREQGKLRAKVDEFFHRAETRRKLEHDSAEARFHCREGPSPVAVYEEFWPHTVFKEAQSSGYTAVDSPDVSCRNKANDQVTASVACQSFGQNPTPNNAYSSAGNTPDSVDHRVKVKARAVQTNRRPTGRAEKQRVTFALDGPVRAQSKPPCRPPRYTRRIEKFLESIINYLSTEDLLVCRRVCRAWKRIIERPEHWLRIELKHAIVSAQIFSEMASWCSAVQSITLEALEAVFEDSNQAPTNARAHLEHGLEKLLRACSKTLKVLKIIGCDNVLTDRILWLASACPFLEVVAYVTVSHVTLPEALWSLGAGCRRVKTLIVPPLDPLKKQGYAGHRVCQMLGKCWPELQVLCIGGRSLTLASLCCVLRSCVNLSSFEIDRGGDIDESSAAVLVEAGLKRIQYLYLTHTVISPGAVIILHGCCPRLKEINLILHRRDFQSTSAFGNFVAGFGALQQREPFDTFVRLALTDDRNYIVEDIE